MAKITPQSPAAAPVPTVGGMTPEQRYLQAIGWQGTEQQYYQSLGLLPGGTPSPQVAAQARQASGGAWPGNISAQQSGESIVGSVWPGDVSGGANLGMAGSADPGAFGGRFGPADTLEQRHAIARALMQRESELLASTAAGTGGPGSDTG